MFDVGFMELVVIFVIGLVVLGPQRLPQVASQVGQWAGRARRMARMLTTQLQDEIHAIDPNRIMDPIPPRPAQPDYSRPGVGDLKPGSTATTDEPTRATPGDPAP